MSITLYLVAGGSLALGVLLMATAQSVFHEAAGFQCFQVAAVSLSGAAIVGALERIAELLDD